MTQELETSSAVDSLASVHEVLDPPKRGNSQTHLKEAMGVVVYIWNASTGGSGRIFRTKAIRNSRSSSPAALEQPRHLRIGSEAQGMEC